MLQHGAPGWGSVLAGCAGGASVFKELATTRWPSKPALSCTAPQVREVVVDLDRECHAALKLLIGMVSALEGEPFGGERICVSVCRVEWRGTREEGLRVLDLPGTPSFTGGPLASSLGLKATG